MRHKRNKETQTSVCLCLLISVATTGIEPVFHAGEACVLTPRRNRHRANCGAKV